MKCPDFMAVGFCRALQQQESKLVNSVGIDTLKIVYDTCVLPFHVTLSERNNCVPPFKTYTLGIRF